MLYEVITSQHKNTSRRQGSGKTVITSYSIHYTQLYEGIPGETIDYGPCAFMEAYDPRAVFSSIDEGAGGGVNPPEHHPRGPRFVRPGKFHLHISATFLHLFQGRNKGLLVKSYNFV